MVLVSLRIALVRANQRVVFSRMLPQFYGIIHELSTNNIKEHDLLELYLITSHCLYLCKNMYNESNDTKIYDLGTWFVIDQSFLSIEITSRITKNIFIDYTIQSRLMCTLHRPW